MRYSRLSKNCLSCGKNFKVQKYRENTAKFCSVECHARIKLGKAFFSRKGMAGPRKGVVLSAELREKMSKAHKGIRITETAKKKLSAVMIQNASKYPNWKGGISRNPDYVSWSKNNWGRRRKSASGSHTWNEWELLKAQYNWTCPCCKKREPEIKLSQDHIVPLSKGGSDNIENIQPLCMPCNLRKMTRMTRYKSD